MKKILFFIPLFMAAILLLGCSNKNYSTAMSSDKLIAETLTPGTASSFSVGGEILKIQVIGPESNVTTHTISVATGTNRGTAETLLSLTVANNTDYILYPKIQNKDYLNAAISGEYTNYYVNDVVTATLTNTSGSTANTGKIYIWYR